MQEHRLRAAVAGGREIGAKGIGSVSNAYGDTQEAGRTLAGATILQIVPALTEGPVARTALDVAQALLQWGARVMIAAEDVPLVAELKSFGGEWIPLLNDTANLFKLRRSARALEDLIAGEQVEHRACAKRRRRMVRASRGLADRSLAGDDLAGRAAQVAPADVLGEFAGARRWVIAPSSFVATAMMERYRLPRERITIVPRGIDTATYDPAAVNSRQISVLCAAWKIADDAQMTPPEMPEDVRTGWVVKPGDVEAFSGAILDALSLDDTAYRAMCARSRQFAEYMFSPQSVAAATRAVYTSLLARDT